MADDCTFVVALARIVERGGQKRQWPAAESERVECAELFLLAKICFRPRRLSRVALALVFWPVYRFEPIIIANETRFQSRIDRNLLRFAPRGAPP